jgi:predicted nucleic acid-binding Zn ribbon protein
MDPRPIGEPLRDFLKRAPAVKHSRATLEWNALWSEVAGPAVSGHSRVRSIRHGVLTIAVDSPPLCHELASFRRETLLAAMNERIGGKAPLRDLYFRHGPL